MRLTEPLPTSTDALRLPLPGWWTHLAPDGRRSDEFPHGHANHGLSHGIAGPLALLALDWLDRWQRTDGDGRAWWPYWTTTPDPDQPTSDQRRIGRPSWCYGTPGVARAQQLAGLALGDTTRVCTAEAALLNAIAAPDPADRLSNPGVCHGLAGMLLITRRAAADSPDRHLQDQTAHLRQLLTRELVGTPITHGGLGLLDGADGIALTVTDAGQGWDACLLTS